MAGSTIALPPAARIAMDSLQRFFERRMDKRLTFGEAIIEAERYLRESERADGLKYLNTSA